MRNISRKGFVQKFVGHLHTAIEIEVAGFGKSPIPTELILSSLERKGNSNNVKPKDNIPALDYLDLAIRNSKYGPPQIQELAESFENLADRLQWYQRNEPEHQDFMQGHANAFIIGPQGLETHGETIIGVSVLAPEIQYPDHKHPAEELYLAMSEGDWRQNKGFWQTPGLGGLIYNPGNIVHSMRAKSQPLLAIWCLWTNPGKQAEG